MAALDRALFLWLNQFAHRSFFVDVMVATVAKTHVLKGMLLIAVLVALWFDRRGDRKRRREIIVATLMASAAAIVAGRVLAYGLPFRMRPLLDPSIPFVQPFGAPETLLRAWSSFPSDHAMLFSAMATGLWFASRRLGIAAHAYVLVVIELPRVYLGLHHPSDIAVGALLGAGLAVVANLAAIRSSVARPVLRWLEVDPRSFYAVAFVIAMQIATMFDYPRSLLVETLAAARGPAVPAAVAETAAAPPSLPASASTR